MEPSTPTLEQEFVKALRQHRAELREGMLTLELALAGPLAGNRERWTGRVHTALVELSADLREHMAITEGPDGLYDELRTAAPRLSEAVSRLTREHAEIGDLLEEALAGAAGAGSEEAVERVRDLCTDLLGRLIRHRQRGADLVFEAYEVDMGGET